MILSLDDVAHRTAPLSEAATEVVDGAHSYGIAHRSSFAGVFGSGEVVYAGFTSDHVQHLTALEERLGSDHVRVFAADHSEDDLIATVERISADLRSLREQGILISSVGVDTRANRVTVTFGEPPGPEWEPALSERYGKNLLVFEQTPRRFFTV